jgi:hypothetical protein
MFELVETRGEDASIAIAITEFSSIVGDFQGPANASIQISWYLEHLYFLSGGQVSTMTLPTKVAGTLRRAVRRCSFWR